MALSAAAQAARANGYGTLRQFREVSASPTYQVAAGAYERKHKLAPRSALKANSRFARLFGKAFYKDGSKRATPPPSYLAKLQQASLTSLVTAESFEAY